MPSSNKTTPQIIIVRHCAGILPTESEEKGLDIALKVDSGTSRAACKANDFDQFCE